MHRLKLSSTLIFALWLFLGQPIVAHAHGGAPDLLVENQAAGPYTVTLWADADVGESVVIIAANLNGDALPPETRVTVWIQPQDGHQPEAGYDAERDRAGPNAQFFAIIPVDQAGTWTGRVVLEGPAGSGTIPFTLEVTPPPPNRTWLIWPLALLPFIVFGGLWLLNARLKDQALTEESSSASIPHEETP